MRTRRFPVIVARVWFVLCTVLVVAIEFVICFTLRNAAEKKWISKRRSERICCFSSGILMGKVLWFLSPQIHVKFMEGSLDWRGIENRGVFCACHTSFFDTIFFLWLCPVEYLLNVRSFAKRALWKMPLMGEVIRACGHLPVHFTAGGPSFAVDKEKQAVVSAAAESFLADGGVLCFFPEGALNPTPEVLTDFRLGTFSMVVKHQVPIHYIVYAGCSEVWDPALKGMPGFPADVYVYVGKYEYDENATAVDVAKGLREEMQRHLDDMLARRKKEQYVPFYKKSTARN
ncbi:putative acyltransferase [Trypanosoma grayi]|uniref:putative acyltransferase n=1 Tax=Trypanosoma grayi TaxID=71804 RepID=UPI0004F41B26|nr:putative acyltransferase [Trypanosoma grayi]KEG14629.1 putative acyltransferase [Trypanosoma grayi]